MQDLKLHRVAGQWYATATTPLISNTAGLVATGKTPQEASNNLTAKYQELLTATN